MITINREMTYINAYVLDKEFKYQDRVREAINLIDYLIRQKRNDRALAIHITSKHYMKKYNLDYSKEFLWKVYRQRLAHIKNGKDSYKVYSMNKRLEGKPQDIKLCECGCGNPVTKQKNNFLNGHNTKCKSEEEISCHTKLMRRKKKEKRENVIPLFKL